MSASHIASLALLWAGVVVIVASSLGMLVFKDTLQRVHYLAPVTSLGAPLVAVSVAIANGWGLTTAIVLLIAFFLIVTGPVLGTATARVVAQHRGLIKEQTPE